MVARITIPIPEEEANLLKREAAFQGRTLSGYMQNLLHDHIQNKDMSGIKEVEVKPKKPIKVNPLKRKNLRVTATTKKRRKLRVKRKKE